MGIPERDVQAWIKEQQKKGNMVIPIGDKIATIPRTINAQMDYKDCILRQIDQTRWSLLYGEKPFALNVIMFVILIPEKDKDDQFREDLKNAKYETSVNTGRQSYFPGKPSTIYKKVWVPDYFAMFEACINLFRRRGMLWSNQQVEVMK